MAIELDQTHKIKRVCGDCRNFLPDTTENPTKDDETNGRCIMPKTGVGRTHSEWTIAIALSKSTWRRPHRKSCFNANLMCMFKGDSHLKITFPKPLFLQETEATETTITDLLKEPVSKEPVLIEK